ncbi:hypothetical protein DIURU_001314 [Diutina rugosa]|uniref:Uncharacterized protein n=1 Tax=Diutina rugosa TaxID=5481 RepID=A0A642V1H7_DIURU|nr:uncharacterized protein DIURU_001314 [Diutina rugosa]KAA8905937.1 hypothetical protein DIURU_001314 [Diutina rugosa]
MWLRYRFGEKDVYNAARGHFATKYDIDVDKAVKSPYHNVEEDEKTVRFILNAEAPDFHETFNIKPEWKLSPDEVLAREWKPELQIPVMSREELAEQGTPLPPSELLEVLHEYIGKQDLLKERQMDESALLALGSLVEYFIANEIDDKFIESFRQPPELEETKSYNQSVFDMLDKSDLSDESGDEKGHAFPAHGEHEEDEEYKDDESEEEDDIKYSRTKRGKAEEDDGDNENSTTKHEQGDEFQAHLSQYNDDADIYAPVTGSSEIRTAVKVEEGTSRTFPTESTSHTVDKKPDVSKKSSSKSKKKRKSNDDKSKKTKKSKKSKPDVPGF